MICYKAENIAYLFSAILNKSDDRHRRAYSVHSSTLDCDSDDSDDEIFNDIYADLNDLDEFEDFDDEDKVVDGVEVYISSDEEDAPANLLWVYTKLGCWTNQCF